MEKCIIDFGAHNGQDTLMYLTMGYYIYSVDANPKMIDTIRNRIPTDLKTNVALINTGISDKDEEPIDFYVNKTSDKWSSFTEYGKMGDKFEILKIPCVSFQTLLDNYISNNHEIFYIKIDIEGYDVKALKSIAETNIRPTYISVENGNGELLNILTSMGYNKFQYINQLNLPGKKIQFINVTNDEKLEYILEDGASGPFGPYLDENMWQSKEDIILQIRKIWNEDGTKNPNHNDGIDGWFDLHATIM